MGARNRWFWKCEDCEQEFYLESYQFCHKCGKARPPAVPLALDEQYEYLAEMLEEVLVILKNRKAMY